MDRGTDYTGTNEVVEKLMKKIHQLENENTILHEQCLNLMNSAYDDNATEENTNPESHILEEIQTNSENYILSQYDNFDLATRMVALINFDILLKHIDNEINTIKNSQAFTETAIQLNEAEIKLKNIYLHTVMFLRDVKTHLVKMLEEFMKQTVIIQELNARNMNIIIPDLANPTIQVAK